MDEPVVDVVASTEPAVAKTEPEPPKTEAPEPKSKGGRPAGAKDKAPRKKKLVIVEEPISKPEIEEAPPPKPVKEAVKPMPVKETPRHVEAPEPEPPSPRSILRESARHMLDLKRLNDSARKTHLQNTYTRRLAAF